MLPLSVTVNGVPYSQSDRETVRAIERGKLIHRGDGLFYEQSDSAGVRKVYLYPAPTEAGQEIELEWVFRPIPLSEDTDEPTEIPQEFHPKLLHFVAATYYRTSEDNPELASYNAEKADLAVSELTRYENLRASGEGPWQVGISGVTA